MARIAVRVVPRSSKNGVSQEGDLLKVWLTAPPVDGAANEALIVFLAERLHVPKRALQVVRGATNRQKVIEIEGLTAEEIAERLKK